MQCMPKRSREHNDKIGAALRARGVGASPTKKCPRCKKNKLRSEFRVRPHNGHSHSYCVPCERTYNAARNREYQERRKRDPAVRAFEKERNRRTVLRLKYGITPETYDEMLEAQGGVCAICRQPPDRGRMFLDVDHCHESGRVRGLLCSGCNRAIGLMGEDAERLRAAAAYVEAALGKAA